MKKLVKKFAEAAFLPAVMVLSMLGASTASLSSPAMAANSSSDACTAQSFLGLPVWYRGLGVSYKIPSGQYVCNVDITAKGTWQMGIVTIAVNVLDDLLRIAGLLSVVFIIIGGFRYITSQGEPAGITVAKQTITRAITGLIIAILSVLILNFIAGTVFKLTVNGDTYKIGNDVQDNNTNNNPNPSINAVTSTNSDTSTGNTDSTSGTSQSSGSSSGSGSSTNSDSGSSANRDNSGGSF